MRYSFLSRRLLEALATGLIVASCSGSAAPTPTPSLQYHSTPPSTMPYHSTPSLSSCEKVVELHDIFVPGEAYELFQGEDVTTTIRHIQYRGGRNFAFLDNEKNIVIPPEARPYANEDGSVRVAKGGKLTFKTALGTEIGVKIVLTIEDYRNNIADVKLELSKCEIEPSL